MTDRAGPLHGRVVVVTRAAHRAGAFAELLTAAGAEAVEMPLVDIVDVAGSDEIATAIGGLGVDDWLVVTSPEGAERVRRAVGDLAGSVLRVAAVGAATAEVLGRADLVPTRQRAAGLIDEFPAPAAADGKVLVVQAVGGTDELVTGLRRLGWHATRVDSHLSLPVVPDEATRARVAAADAVAFTSGSQARAWALVFGDHTPPVVAAIGPQTADDARAAGLTVTTVAVDHSLAGLVAALVEAFADRDDD